MARRFRNEVDNYDYTLNNKLDGLQLDELNILTNISDVDNRFKLLLIKFANFLRKQGYCISTDALLKFFKMYRCIDIFKIEEMCNILKCIFASTKDQHDEFEKLFNMFFFGVAQKSGKDSMKKIKQHMIEAQIKRAEESTDKNDYSYRRKKEEGETELKEYYSSNGEGDIDKLLEKMNIAEKEKAHLRKLMSLQQEDIMEMLKEDREGKTEELKKNLNELMMCNMLSENIQEVNQLILVSSKVLIKISEFIKKKDTELERKINKIKRDIEKQFSMNNRIEFTKGKNNVKTKNDILSKQIAHLSNDEMQSIGSYIRVNASRFKTRISRNMKSDKNKEFDYIKTIRASMKTFGTPIELKYKKPKINKVKIVCILDVSGSCIEPAKLLLNFVYELSEIFKGGVRSFVFVRELDEVTDLFKTCDLKEAMERAVIAVPNKGSYSDYDYAFSRFDKKYLDSAIDKNTVVIYLGDARNNRNDSGEQYLEKVVKRAKNTVWINCEKRSMWDTGDSIMSVYSKYVNDVYEVLTTKDLINFLYNFNIKS